MSTFTKSMTTKSSFDIVLKGLHKSAKQLEEQQQEAAKKTIEGISGEIQFLEDIAKRREREFEEKQLEFAKLVQEITLEEARIHDSARKTQIDIKGVEGQLRSKKATQAGLTTSLKKLDEQVKDLNEKIEAAQRRRDRLHDDSAGSIALSIFTLGLDRAVMAIDSEVKHDRQTIKDLSPEIRTFRSQISRNQQDLKSTKNFLKKLGQQHSDLSAEIKKLQAREMELHNSQSACRKKAAFFTDVALFYGKLVVLANQVEHRIQDVADIVAELDDETPRIVDFDGSGEDVISLGVALTKFDSFLDDNAAWNQNH